jgi:hypothetical protein
VRMATKPGARLCTGGLTIDDVCEGGKIRRKHNDRRCWHRRFERPLPKYVIRCPRVNQASEAAEALGHHEFIADINIIPLVDNSYFIIMLIAVINTSRLGI